jgi:amino acid adenylation domain-containing protein
MFQQQVVRTPDAVAIVYRDEHVSYEQVRRRAEKLAGRLADVEEEGELIVGLCVQRSAEAVMAVLGVLSAGGAYVPLNPEYPQRRLQYMAADAGARVIVSRREYEAVVGAMECEKVWLESIWEEQDEQNSKDERSRVRAEAAYILYTSGSTGEPKGVIGRQKSTINRLRWMWERYPFEQWEVCCAKTTLSFVDSVWEMLGPMLKGIKTVVVGEQEARDVRELIRQMSEQAVTRIVVVPSLLEAMMRSDPDIGEKLREVKYWVSSGEELSKELKEEFRSRIKGARLLNLYGTTEVAGDVSYEEVEEEGEERRWIGRAISDSEMLIVGRGGELVPIGIDGEIVVGGENLARGYKNRGDLTAEKFVPREGGGRRVYRTGDRGRLGEDGKVEYVGREDQQVKIRGQRVEIGEVERGMKEVDGVRESVVVAREEDGIGRR